MQIINEIIKKHNIKPKKYKKIKTVTLIETENKKYIIKQNTKDIKNIYEYLQTRNFNYIPKILNKDEDYEITEYIQNYDIPKEQKIIDMIYLVSLLHNKTTHYKETTEDDFKELYEDINNNIQYLFGYYNDLITLIETKVYMSPCEYLIARNFTKILESLYYSKQELDSWYKIVKEKTKQRLVVLHNNLELDHFIENENKYLISWNKAKIGIPSFDLYKLYKKHGLEVDFEEIYKIYIKNSPLQKEEQKLFFILISLPQTLKLDKTEYQNTIEAGKMIDLIYKTQEFISPYNSNKTPEDNAHK